MDLGGDLDRGPGHAGHSDCHSPGATRPDGSALVGRRIRPELQGQHPTALGGRLERRFRWSCPLGGMERPRRKERFARLIQRRGRAFWRAFGPRRLRRQSQPALVATQGGAADVPRSAAGPGLAERCADRSRWCVWWTGAVRSRGYGRIGTKRRARVNVRPLRRRRLDPAAVNQHGTWLGGRRRWREWLTGG